MRKTVLNRSKIRLIMFISFLILSLCISSVVSFARAQRLTRQLNASSQRSLSSLSSYISSINSDLTKGVYSNSQAMLSEVVNNLTRDASGAKNALSSLSVSDLRLDNTFKFLSQVASFVGSLDRSLSLGHSVTDAQRQKMLKLIEISQTLSSDISDIIDSVESGEMSLREENESLESANRDILSLSKVLGDAEEQISDYPTLIYDGPFSDSIGEKESEMLKSAQEITSEQALIKAAAFMEADTESLKREGEAEGSIPSYIFSSGGSSIAVSKRGGYVVYLLGSSFAGEEKIGSDKARENARSFLEKNGFKNMTDSYYSVSDGICTLNFAYSADGIICYPDLIKVSVSLESGRVISFDASGYIMNHRSRSISSPAITEAQARSKLSPLLKVLSCRRAIIPTEYETEQDTYEFHCEDRNGQELLVYIDTVTGAEDNILILLYSDNGILTK